MRLLDTHTGQFVEKDPKDEKTVYAILSHTWDPAGEQTYKQLRKIQKRYAAKPQPPPNDPESSHVSEAPPSASAVPLAVPLFDERAALSHRTDHASDEGLEHEDTRVTSEAWKSAAVGSFRRILQLVLCIFEPVTQLFVQLTRCTLYLKALSLILPEPPSTLDNLCATPGRPAEPAPDPSTPATSEDDVETPLSLIRNDPELSQKIREACRVAREAGYRYLWIDSCCIDKTSSSELSEAINSMYLWYALAKVCYAYLSDVLAPGEDPRADESAFRSSRWFQRGWTLQELIAPIAVTFFSQDWKMIETKLALADLVAEITGIPEEALLHAESLDEFSVAERFSWAARRKTTREEDRAYSLLGIFSISMPTLYGEGAHAFRRLQEEIVRRIPDLSLFAWKSHICGNFGRNQDLVESLHDAQSFEMWRSSLTPFDSNIDHFKGGGKIRAIPHDDVFDRLKLTDLPAPEYTFTPHGIRTQLPAISLSLCLPQRTTKYPVKAPQSQWYLVILGCEHDDYPGSLLGQVCYIPPSHSGVEYLYYGWVDVRPGSDHVTARSELFPLSSATIQRCFKHIQVKTVYISQPERAAVQSAAARWQPHETIKLALLRKARDARRARRYTAELQRSHEGHDSAHRLMPTLPPNNDDNNDDATIQSEAARWQPHETINLLLLRKTRDALRAQGYTAELRSSDEDHPTAHWLTLSNDDHVISVEYQHTLENEGRRFTIEAHARMSSSAETLEANPRTVRWSDFAWWESSLGTEEVAFTLAAEKLIVKLSLDFSAPSYYVLRIEIGTETLPAADTTSLESTL